MFNGHKGFDVDLFVKTLEKCLFTNISHKQCFIEKRENEYRKTKEYPNFLLVTKKSD